MKNNILLICLLVVISLPSCYGQTANKVNNDKQGFAVLELFTSEGCSSCPPADALLPVLKDEYKGKLYTLAFHVDYWNRLGWKDKYSSSKYSGRQSQYASSFHSNTVYTPQAVVNGTHQITGSNKKGLEKIINNELQNSRQEKIIISAKKNGHNSCSVSYHSGVKSGEVLHIALLQLHATTQVKNGENSGRTLQHQNVVRMFETLQQKDGEIDFKIPDGLSYDQCHIIAYTQQKNDMHITGVAETAIE